MNEQDHTLRDIDLPTDRHALMPEAHVDHRRRFSWVWLTPILALGLVAYLLYDVLSDRGPMVSITFDTADGLMRNQTRVKYKAVTLGTVEEVELSDDLTHVVAKVRMNAEAEPLLTDAARFWVVRPRMASGLAALQSGVEALVSGTYIAIDPGARPGAPAHEFVGLEDPPGLRSDEPGTVYILESERLGGLGPGSPVYYRDVEVGDVLRYELDETSQAVRLHVFVVEPYDDEVRRSTRFWNASGLDVATGSGGLHIELQSLRSLLTGGIAFHTPLDGAPEERSAPESTFTLYESRAAAEVGFFAPSYPYVSYFQTSVRGLAEGSEVHMFGRQLGTVTEVALVRDPRIEHEGEFAVRVAYVLQPARGLRRADQAALGHEQIGKLVDARLRVVLKTSNILTGQKELSLEYVPGAEPVQLVEEGDALVLPGSTQDLSDLSSALSDIAGQIQKIPFAEIGRNLNRSLVAVERTVGGPQLQRAIASLDAALSEVRDLAKDANEGLGPALERLPGIATKLERAVDQVDGVLGERGYGADSTVQRNMERMMEQVGDAARSLRILADFLNRHPESLIRGRSATEAR